MRAVRFVVTVCCSLPGSWHHANDVLALELHVAPDGVDHGDGTATAPLKTLLAAWDRLRGIRRTAGAEEQATVWIHPGHYFLTDAWELNQEDSGSEGAPTIWRAVQPGSVRIIGGRQVQELQPVIDPHVLRSMATTARGHVRQADLRKAGISDYGVEPRRGRDLDSVPAALEVFQGGRPLTLARTPNIGWIRWLGDPDAIPMESGVHSSTGWMKAPTTWVHGFPTHDWSDLRIPIVETPIHGDSGEPITTPWAHGQRFYCENALELLDEPGEWYLDHATNILYVWPNQENGFDPIVVSTLQTPVSLYGVSHVTLKDLTIEVARVCGAEVAGGAHVRLENCAIRNNGNWGVHIYHGDRHQLLGCEVGHTGEGGSRIEGGDRDTLTESGHQVTECRVHHFNRNVLAGRAGISLYGVGHQVVRNVIQDGAGEGIAFQGNEHVVDGNEVCRVCQQLDDVGAICLCQDWTQRSNRIRHNFVHDLCSDPADVVIGVYLDDFTSGTLVEGNVFQNAGRGVLVGGGRDNVIRNNLFVDGVAGVQLDSRGQSWVAFPRSMYHSE